MSVPTSNQFGIGLIIPLYHFQIIKLIVLSKLSQACVSYAIPSFTINTFLIISTQVLDNDQYFVNICVVCFVLFDKCLDFTCCIFTICALRTPHVIIHFIIRINITMSWVYKQSLLGIWSGEGRRAKYGRYSLIDNG